MRRWPVVGLLALAVSACSFSPRVAPGRISCASSEECPSEVPFCQSGACFPQGWDGAVAEVPVTPMPDAATDKVDVVMPTPDVAMEATPDRTSPDTAVEAGADVTPVMDVPPDVPLEWPNCVPPAAPNLATGLVFYLHLDETGSNPVALDASPNHLAVSVSNLGTGAARATGRFGGALSLAGGPNGGWITVGGPVVLSSIIDQLTMSVWVKFPPGVPPDGVLLSRLALGAHGYLYRMSIANGRLHAQLHTSNGNNADVTGNRALDTKGHWMHLAVTYGDTGGLGVELFVDGESHGADRGFALQLGAENTSVLAGGGEDPKAANPSTTIIDRFAGTMDEMAVYKRTLTAAEIKALSCGAMPPTTAMLTSGAP